MTSTLVVETGAGLANSNTNISWDDADTYFADRLDNATWCNASIDKQNRALLMSTRLLDENVDWKGIKADDDQALEWPRVGVKDRSGYVFDSDEMPTVIKNATAEFAQWLLASDRTLADEDDTKGFKRIKAGSLELEVDGADRKDLIPRVVRRMIEPYGTIAGGPVIGVVRS